MSRSPRTVFSGAVMVAASALVAAAQGTSTLVPDVGTFARGDLATISIQNAPATSASPTVFLRRGGETFVVAGATFVPPAAGQTTGAAIATVPIHLPLGDYDVVVTLDHRQPYRATLRVHPPGVPRIALSEFSPSHTYVFQTAHRPDEEMWTPRLRAVQDIVLNRPFDRSERGGLAVDAAPIVWRDGTCADLPPVPAEERQAVTAGVIGTWSGEDAVVLCRVPEGATVTFRGQQASWKRSPGGGPAAPQMWIRQYGRGIAQPVIDLNLHGSGFQADRPEDHTIWINGLRTPVVWDGCPLEAGLGTPTVPTGLAIHGSVPGPNSMTLCSVPVPANGRLQVAVGFGDTPSETREFRVFSMTARRVAALSLLIAVVLALVPLALLAFMRKSLVIGGQPYRFRLLFLDSETETYSLSKLQFYMWTAAALFGYAYLVISRVRIQGGTWPDVPGTLPGIIAVAGGTAVGAQVITSMKGSKGGGEQWPSVADLITSGGVVAIDRVQMLLWTIFGVGTFVYLIPQLGPGTITDLPAVPETLMYLMGLSSAGYLGGKLARKAGPVITEISLKPPESDQAIVQRVASAAFQPPNLVSALIEADKDLQGLPAVTQPNAKSAFDALKSAVGTARAATTQAQLTQLIAELSKARTAAEAAAQRAADDFTAGKAQQADAQAAQQAAAALQNFASSVTAAVSGASADAMATVTDPPLITRTIEIRGTNLAPEAFFAIDQADLLFRMLVDPEQKSQPEIVVREPTAPTLARVLRLTIDPARLATPDHERLQKWFGTAGRRTFTMTNPDGQKAEVSFAVIGPTT